MRSERQSERTHTGFQTQRTRTAPIGCILAPISVQARRKGHKRAGQNPKKEKIDRLEKKSALLTLKDRSERASLPRNHHTEEILTDSSDALRGAAADRRAARVRYVCTISLRIIFTCQLL